MKDLKKQSLPTGIHCKKCKDGEYQIRWGKNGQFLACSHYPECNSTEDFKKNLEGVITIVPKEYASDVCPTCGKRMTIKKGKFGKFLACEEYPTCMTTLPFTIDVHCPECKVGKFAEKKSRFGKFFYGCSKYPDCNNAMWTKPYAFACPKCGYAVMGEKTTKKNGKQLECPKCRHRVDMSETPFATAEE
jgi:DNA topoisomerase-1